MSNALQMKTNKQTKLKKWIDEHGVKQKWMCERTGITQAWMSKIVNGSEPRVRDAIKIARVLGVMIEELWPLEEDEY